MKALFQLRLLLIASTTDKELARHVQYLKEGNRIRRSKLPKMAFDREPVRPRMLLLDHDTKFVQEFDQVFKDEGVEVKRVGLLVPSLNAHVERSVQTVKRECLDHFCGLRRGTPEAHLVGVRRTLQRGAAASSAGESAALGAEAARCPAVWGG
jgi:hypothetical protein